MKKLTLALILFTNVANAQIVINEIPSITFSTGAFFHANSEGTKAGIEGGILFPKHWINFGIGLNIFKVSSTFSQKGVINLNYNLMPNGYSNRFNLFFYFNYFYATRPSKVHNYTKNYFAPVNDFSVGLGFIANLTDNIYLKPGFGGGSMYIILPDRIWSKLSMNGHISLGYRFNK